MQCYAMPPKPRSAANGPLRLRGGQGQKYRFLLFNLRIWIWIGFEDDDRHINLATVVRAEMGKQPTPGVGGRIRDVGFELVELFDLYWLT